MASGGVDEAILDVEGRRRLQRAEAQDHREAEQQVGRRGRRRTVRSASAPARHAGRPSRTPKSVGSCASGGEDTARGHRHGEAKADDAAAKTAPELAMPTAAPTSATPAARLSAAAVSAMQAVAAGWMLPASRP